MSEIVAPLLVNEYPPVPVDPPQTVERRFNVMKIKGIGTYARAGKYGSWIQRFFRLTLSMRCQMLLNVALLFLVTYLTVIITEDDSAYMRNAKRSIREVFAPGEPIDDEFHQIYLYTWKEAVSHINRSVVKFFAFNDTNPDRWLYLREPDGEFEPIRMTVTSYTNRNLFHLKGAIPFDKKTTVYNLTADSPLGPFNASSEKLGEMFEVLYTMKLHSRILNPSFSVEDEIVYRMWTIDVNYDFRDRGGRILIDIHIDNQVYKPLDSVQSFQSALHPLRMATNVAIVILSLVTMIVCFKSLSVAFMSYQDHIHLGKSVPWRELGIVDKSRTMGFWFILNQLSLIVNIIGSCMEMVWLLGYWQSNKNVINIVMGLEPMLAWIHVLRYFEVMSAHRSILAVALRKGLQSAFTFFIYAFPIFIGYALFGMRYFSETTVMFKSFDQAAVTLFAVLNGDIINDTFGAIAPAQNTVSRIYLYTFIFLFIYACLNIFIVIMEDSFHLAKVHEKRYRNRYEHYFNQQLWDGVLRERGTDDTQVQEVDMYDYIPSGDMPLETDHGRPHDEHDIENMRDQVQEMEASQRRLVSEIEALRSAHNHLAATVDGDQDYHIE